MSRGFHALLRRAASRRAFSLVEILIVCAMLVLLAAFLYPRIAGNSRGKDGKATTPLAKAHDTECISNIRSVRQSIEAFKASDSDGKNPQSLSDLPGLPKDFLLCPVGKVPYKYDPQTGEVHCPYPSHEKF